MSQLLCPRCEDGGDLYWGAPEDPNLLESGKMICRVCNSRYLGIHGWMAATNKESEKRRHTGSDLMTSIKVFFDDHPHGAAGIVNGRWLLQDCNGKTVSYGKGMTDAAQRYIHLRYGQGTVRRSLSGCPLHDTTEEAK